MSNTENTTTAAAEGTTPATEDKTFSQDDVNRIVSERLAKEKSKADAAIAQREQDLAHREFLLTAKETLTSKGFPTELLDALNTSSPEAFEKSLDILTNNMDDLIAGAKKQKEPPKAGGGGFGDKLPPLHGCGIREVRSAMGLE